MARDLQSPVCNQRMASKIKMLKLLQESRALADLADQRPISRAPTPLLLQYSFSRRKKGADKRKRVVRIYMQEPEDIPCVIKITQVKSGSLGSGLTTGLI